MSFFDYELPPQLIAQYPLPARDESRLLVLHRASGRIEHRRFRDLPDLLRPADLLILNDTRVLPARLVGRRERSGGRWQGLFVGVTAEGLWEMICQTRRMPQIGEFIQVEPGPLRLELVQRTPEATWLVRPDPPGTPADLLDRHGQTPIPHYIRSGHAEPADAERYQTIYAHHMGAVAAPTAGLHFSAAVFDRLRQRGISWATLTLHVGIGTFQPIRAGDYRRHVMHREWGELPLSTVEAITRCRDAGGRVVAVGTTTVRVLETVAAAGPIAPWTGHTSLYIHPPFQFRAVDALVTNFHLPKSSLLLLVSAFAGEGRLQAVYAEAIANEYRFYSYGDAMLIE